MVILVKSKQFWGSSPQSNKRLGWLEAGLKTFWVWCYPLGVLTESPRCLAWPFPLNNHWIPIVNPWPRSSRTPAQMLATAETQANDHGRKAGQNIKLLALSFCSLGSWSPQCSLTDYFSNAFRTDSVLPSFPSCSWQEGWGASLFTIIKSKHFQSSIFFPWWDWLLSKQTTKAYSWSTDWRTSEDHLTFMWKHRIFFTHNTFNTKMTSLYKINTESFSGKLFLQTILITKSTRKVTTLGKAVGSGTAGPHTAQSKAHVVCTHLSKPSKLRFLPVRLRTQPLPSRLEY